MIWLCMIAHRRGKPNRSYDFLMKAARDYLERNVWRRCARLPRSPFQSKRDATPAPTRPPSAGKPTGICYDFQAGKCTRGKDCRYRHEKADKGKGGGKKGKSRSKSRGNGRSLSPGSMNQVCKFWKAGMCQRGNDCAFQHPPKPAAASTKDDKRGKSRKRRRRTRRRAIAPDRQVEVPIPREALRVLRAKGKTIFLWLQLQFA